MIILLSSGFDYNRRRLTWMSVMKERFLEKINVQCSPSTLAACWATNPTQGTTKLTQGATETNPRGN
jgi:hypothetical protein